MKKKFISIAKKAMVWTMAASMLVATPLTASAQGLSDIYKIEDQWGNSVDPDGTKRPAGTGDYGEQSRTGTVTNTATTILKDAGITGIAIDQVVIEENYTTGLWKTLSVSLLDGDGNKIKKDDPLATSMQDKFSWKSSDTAVASFASMVDKNRNTSEMRLNINGGGTATITVSLDDYKNDIHFSDTIDVYITRYAETISFKKDWLEADAIAGASLALDEYLDVYPANATDRNDIKFAIVKNLDNNKQKATLKNGVLTLNKNSGSTDTQKNVIKIIAIGAINRSDATEVEIVAPNPAKSAEFAIDGQKSKVEVKKSTNTYKWSINDDSRDVTASVELKAGNDQPCTDRIASWTSNKPAIVEVETIARTGAKDKGTSVKLHAMSVGDAQITAKTTSGKSFKLKAKVSATLTGVRFDVVPDVVYSGQTLNVEAVQEFECKKTKDTNDNFKDEKLKWSVGIPQGQTVAAKKLATVKNGVLTVKTTIPMTAEKNDPKITITAAKGTATATTKAIDVQQVCVTDIIVYPTSAVNHDAATDAVKNGLAKAELTAAKKVKNKTAKISIATEDTNTYGLWATGYKRQVAADGSESLVQIDGNAANVLGWSVSNTKVAKVAKSNSAGTITGVKKGSAKVTVNSVANTAKEGKPAKYTAIKVTLNTTVTQPSKTLKLTAKVAAIANNKKKKLSIKVTPVLDKGSSTKANNMIWTAYEVNDKGESVQNLTKMIKNGTLTLPKNNSLESGNTVVVKGTIRENNKSYSLRLRVVEPSKKPEIKIVQGTTEIVIKSNKCSLDASIPETGYKDFVLTPSIDGKTPSSKEPTVAAVTYTLSRQDIIRILDNGDGTVTIKPVSEGTVKLTPVTADGVKGKNVSIKVENVDWVKGASVYSVE